MSESFSEPSQPEPEIQEPIQDNPARSKKKITIAIGLVLAVAATGGASYYFLNPSTSPMEDAYNNCLGSKALRRVLAFQAEKNGITPSGSTSPAGDTTTTEPDSTEALDAIYEGVLSLEDNGATIIIDTKGQDEDILALGSLNAECVLIELEAPERVKQSMKSTRAMDGRMSDAWGEYSAQWSYHPDSGMDMIIYKNEGN